MVSIACRYIPKLVQQTVSLGIASSRTLMTHQSSSSSSLSATFRRPPVLSALCLEDIADPAASISRPRFRRLTAFRSPRTLLRRHRRFPTPTSSTPRSRPLFLFFLLVLRLFRRLFRLGLLNSLSPTFPSSRPLLDLLLFGLFLVFLLLLRSARSTTGSSPSTGRLSLDIDSLRRASFGGFGLACNVGFEGLFFEALGLVFVEDLDGQLTFASTGMPLASAW